jgi:hypothetical protein
MASTTPRHRRPPGGAHKSPGGTASVVVDMDMGHAKKHVAVLSDRANIKRPPVSAVDALLPPWNPYELHVTFVDNVVWMLHLLLFATLIYVWVSARFFESAGNMLLLWFLESFALWAIPQSRQPHNTDPAWASLALFLYFMVLVLGIGVFSYYGANHHACLHDPAAHHPIKGVALETSANGGWHTPYVELSQAISSPCMASYRHEVPVLVMLGLVWAGIVFLGGYTLQIISTTFLHKVELSLHGFVARVKAQAALYQEQMDREGR